jgi:acyl carrier protein
MASNPTGIHTRDEQHQLAEFFRERLLLEVPSCNTDLLETGILDSLTLIELLVWVEERFGTKIPLEHLELDNFRTLRQIEQLLYRARRSEAV